MGTDPRLVRLHKIQSEPVTWLWNNRIPLGALTIVEGDPGQGKSTLLYDVAARVSKGRPMPFCAEEPTPGGVVVLTGEDSVATTVRPSLKEAGANLRRVMVYDRRRGDPLTFPDDLDVIEDAIGAVNAKLVIIDPISAFLAVSLSSEHQVRKVLGLLARLADQANIAIVLLRHLTKFVSPNAVYRGIGSIGLIGAARSVLVATNDKTTPDPYHHVLHLVKSNLGAAPDVVYRTARSGQTTTIQWLGERLPSCSDASTALVHQSMEEEALVVLYHILRNGPLPADEVVRRARKARVSERTLRRAKSRLGVPSRREGSGWSMRWYWLPPTDQARIAEVLSLAQHYELPNAQSTQENLGIPPHSASDANPQSPPSDTTSAEGSTATPPD